MTRKIYCTKCKKHKKKLKKRKIPHVCRKILLLSSICNNYRYKDEKIFKEEHLIEILKIHGLINNM